MHQSLEECFILDYVGIFNYIQKKLKALKKIILLLILAAPISINSQNKKVEKSSFEVSGNCEMCKKRIEKSALSLKGVKSASWDIPSNMISILYDPNKVTLQNIHIKIASIGHDTSSAKAKEEAYNQLPMCCIYRRTIE